MLQTTPCYQKTHPTSLEKVFQWFLPQQSIVVPDCCIALRAIALALQISQFSRPTKHLNTDGGNTVDLTLTQMPAQTRANTCIGLQQAAQLLYVVTSLFLKLCVALSINLVPMIFVKFILPLQIRWILFFLDAFPYSLH